MGISLLSILLFALVSPVVIDFTIFHDQQHALYYGLVFFLLFLIPIYDLYNKKFPIFDKLRPLTVWLIILITVGLGMVIYVFDRHKISPAYRVNDIVIQQEAAVQMLITHKNPYASTYFGTPLELFVYSPTEKNPALYHFVMEPLYLTAAVPFYFLENHLFGFFDSRVPLYLLFLALLIGGYRIIPEKENKLLFITLMTFNPMTLRFLLEGRSDMFMFPFLFGAFYFLYKGRFGWGSIFTALAFSIKQTAWPFFPFYLYFIYLKTKDYKEVLKQLVIFSIVLGISVLPFLVWNPYGFVDSTIFYLSGNTAHSYPISGFGFSGFITALHIVKDAHAYYPFIIWQLLFAIPVLIILLKYLKKHPTVRVLIACYALFLLVFWYFSRYFNDSHLGFISSVLITAYFWPKEEKN